MPDNRARGNGEAAQSCDVEATESVLVIKLIIFIIILIFPYLNANAENKANQYKVGAVLALTGSLNIQGVPMKNAMVLAKKEFDKGDKLKLIFEDDGFIPKNSIVAATKLVKQDKVDLLIVFGTNQGLSVVGLTEQNKLPMISLNVNRSVVRGKKYATMAMPAVESLTELNIKESERRGYKKVAIVATQQDSCLLQRKLYEESGKFKIVAIDDFPPGDVNFRETLPKILNHKPDAVFLSVMPPQGSVFSRRLRELGFSGEIFGGLQLAFLAELRASQGALEGAWVVAGDDRNAGEYYKKYRAEYGEDASAESVYAYDSVRLVLAGIEHGDVNAYLHTVKDFPGTTRQFSADGMNGFTLAVVAKEFAQNSFKYISE